VRWVHDDTGTGRAVELPIAGARDHAPPGGAVGRRRCASLLPEAEVVAVLWLPLDGVVGGEVRDIPAPQIGRLARQRCGYSSVDPRGPATGLVLEVTVGTFADPGAARAQDERDVADVAGAVAPLPTRLGAATAAIGAACQPVGAPGRVPDHTVEVAGSDRVGG
jgi:hypothetical protein